MKLSHDRWLDFELEGMSIYRHDCARFSGVPKTIIDHKIELFVFRSSMQNKRSTQKIYVLDPERRRPKNKPRRCL